MKKVLVFIVLFLVEVNCVDAKRGCCSHHGGVAGCNSNGRQICNDGTLSPTCTCTPSYIYGCTDSSAKNYNANANKDNGSCVYYKYGCTNENSINYDYTAEKDDGSCVPIVYGCMDRSAKNYNSEANVDDGSCVTIVYGCTDKNAKNYNSDASTDDGSCKYDNNPKLKSSFLNENSNEEKETKLDINGIVGIGIIGIIGYFIFKENK